MAAEIIFDFVKAVFVSWLQSSSLASFIRCHIQLVALQVQFAVGRSFDNSYATCSDNVRKQYHI